MKDVTFEEFSNLAADVRTRSRDAIYKCENMRPFATTLFKAKFDLPVPDNGPEKIVRRGILFCSEVSACQFAMLPLPAAQ